MSDEPINAWILDPVMSAVDFVAEEAKIGGLLQRALAHIEGGRPMLELAARHLAATHNRKAVGAIRRLLSEAPIQESWAAELRSDNYALLNGHSLVAIWGALETCIEDTVVGILEPMGSDSIDFSLFSLIRSLIASTWLWLSLSLR